MQLTFEQLMRRRKIMGYANKAQADKAASQRRTREVVATRRIDKKMQQATKQDAAKQGKKK